MKHRNPRFGCPRIAQEIAHAFGIEIDKDVVRRVLARHYRPGDAGATDPSWLTLIVHAKDSLWSIDPFRCESIPCCPEFRTNQSSSFAIVEAQCSTEPRMAIDCTVICSYRRGHMDQTVFKTLVIAFSVVMIHVFGHSTA